MPTFCRNEGECSKRLRGEREWRFFVSEKCLIKTRLLRARVCSRCAFFAFFFLVSRCVCPLVACGYCFFRVVWPSTKECNTPTKRRIKYSLKSLSTYPDLITDIKRTRRAFTLSRERESLGALNNSNNNNDSFFIVSAFFLKSFIGARAPPYNICASCAHLITRPWRCSFPWCDDDRRKKNTRVSPFSRERRRQKRRIAKDNTVVAVVCRAR